MENISQNAIIKQSLLNSIDREDLLMKKYEGYKPLINDYDTNELLNEFQETAREHMDLLKGKLKNHEI